MSEEVLKVKARVPPRATIIFTRQLAAMLINGVPLVQALDTLSHQAEEPNFGQVVRILAEKISAGHPFSHALNGFPTVFPRIYVTMVSIGEQTGQLDVSLEKLATWAERDFQIQQRIKSALTYPTFVFGLACALTLALFYWVIPGFINIFEDMRIPLPFLTRLVIGTTHAIREPGTWLIALALLGVLGPMFRDFARTPHGSRALFGLALRVPQLGGMLRNGTLARYCGALEALLSSGMDLPRAFKLSGHASGNPLLAADAEELVGAVMEGELASAHMLRHPELYPPGLVQMAIAGEQASRVPEMFARAAAYYEMEAAYQIEALSASLEPLLLAGVSGLVGTIVVAIFLPMYGYLDKLGG